MIGNLQLTNRLASNHRFVLFTSLLTMNLYHTVVIVLNLFTAQADNDESVLDHFFSGKGRRALIVKEGVSVSLSCNKENGNEVSTFITFESSENSKPPVKLIDSSNMTYISSKYAFIESNDNMYVFTIKSISIEDDGVYRCVQNYGIFIKTRDVIVIYNPSENSPRCSSNHKSPVIFYNEMKEYFIFNCITERGRPPVITRVYVNGREFSFDLEITNETRTDEKHMLTTYSMSQRFNETLQNYYFVCNVTQELPSPYDDYQGSCSFGPLHLLSGFSLSVSPSNVTVRDESKVTFICASNVTEVEITWNNVPSEKYYETNHNGSSVLTILTFKPSYNGTDFVECIGSYGTHRIKANATVLLMNTKGSKNESNEENANGTLITLFVVSMVSVGVNISFVSVALAILWKRKRRKGRHIEVSLDDNTLEGRNMSENSIEQSLGSSVETSMKNTNTVTYTTTMRPESQESGDVHIADISAQIYNRTIVSSDPPRSNRRYYDISSKPTRLYDSTGYLIPDDHKINDDHTKFIYNEID